MRPGIRRLHTVPFESFFGWLILVAGIVGLFHLAPSNDPLDVVLGPGLVAFFNATYAASGLLMLVGLYTGRAWIEGPGIVLLVMGALVRLAAILVLYGFDRGVAISIVFYALLGYYAVVRLFSLWRGEVIFRADPNDVTVEK